MIRLVSSTAALTLTGLLIAGCGGGSSNSTTSAADWASGYCKAANSWVTTLSTAQATIDPGDPTVTASDAAETMTNETNTFTTAIDGLGQPDTPDGATTKDTASNLTKTLQGRVGRATAAIDTTNPDVTPVMQASTVKEQVKESIQAISDATKTIAADDTETGQAMKDSSDCTTLNASLEKAS